MRLPRLLPSGPTSRRQPRTLSRGLRSWSGRGKREGGEEGGQEGIKLVEGKRGKGGEQASESPTLDSVSEAKGKAWGRGVLMSEK